jgi:PAS domain S-box-containing protein
MFIMTFKIIFNYLFLFLIFSINAGFSQSSYESIFKNYTTKDGLPANEIRKIFQDSKDNIWVGTSSGAYIFSGKQGKLIDSDKGLINNNIRSFNEIDGKIYIGTDAGFSVYAYGAIQKLKFGMDFKPEKTIGFLPSINGDVLAFSTSKIYLITKSNAVRAVNFKGLPRDLIFSSVLFKDDKSAYIGTSNGKGIYKVKFGKSSIEVSNPLHADSLSSIKNMQLDEFGNVWILSSGKLFRLVNDKLIPFLAQPKATEFPAYNFVVDNNQTIYLSGFDQGVLRIKGFEKEFYSSNSGLYSETVTQLFIDNKGFLWVGTVSDGLFVNFDEPFKKITTKFGLPSNQIRNVFAVSSTEQYISTLNGLVKIKDGKIDKIFNETNGLSFKRVGQVSKGTKGTIYVSSYDGYLNIIENDIVKKKIQIANSEIIATLMDANDNLYLATQGEGVYLYKNNQVVKLNSFSKTNIESIYQDRYGGQIYFGTSDGLYVLKNNEIRPFIYSGKVKITSSITGIKSDNKKIYVATGSDGFYQIEKQTKLVSNVRIANGLPTNNVASFEFLNDTSLILFSSKGSYLVNGVQQALSDSNKTVYYYQYELPFLDYIKNGITKTGPRQFWVSTSEGVLIYDGALQRNKRDLPNVSITNIKFPYADIDWNQFGIIPNSIDGIPDNFTFPSDVKALVFLFSLNSVKNSANIKYQHYLEGYENNYNPPSALTSATFSNLSYGDYVFHVRATYNERTIGKEKLIKFKISRPIWASPLFLMVSAFFVVLAIFLFFLKKNKIEKSENEVADFYSSNAVLKPYAIKLALLIAGIGYPINNFSIPNLFPHIKVDYTFTFIFAAFCILSVIASFIFDWVKKHLIEISYMAYFFLLIHIFYLAYLNRLDLFYLAGLIITICGGGLAFSRNREMVIFIIVCSICCLLLIIFTNSPVFNPFYFAYYVMLSVLMNYFVFKLREDQSNKLKISEVITSNSNNIILVANNDGKIIFANEKSKQVMGNNNIDAFGETWLQNADLSNNSNQVFSQTSSENSKVKVYKNKLNSEDGKSLSMLWNDTKLENGITIGVGQDITEFEALQNKFEYILDRTNEFIYTTDGRGRFIYLNEACKSLFGYEKEELLGKHFTILIVPEIQKETWTVFLNMVKDKVFSTYHEVLCQRKDGSRIWIGQNVKLEFDHYKNRHSGFQSVARDIDELKNARLQIEKYSYELAALNNIKGNILFEEKMEDVSFGVAKQLYQVISNAEQISIGKKQEFKNKIDLYRYNGQTDIESNTIEIVDLDFDFMNLENGNLSLNKNTLIFPLKHRNQVLGFIKIVSRTPIEITNYEVLMNDCTQSLSDAIVMRRAMRQLAETNHEVSSSITYAKRIQEGVLPDMSLLDDILKSFVFYLPRDIVSGDFYWMHRKKNTVYIAVVDCTGHGVPGAFLSLIGSSLLNKIILQNKNVDLKELLQELNSEVVEIVNKKNLNKLDVSDGMDLTIVKIDYDTHVIEYANAARSSYFVTPTSFNEIDASIHSIGGIYDNDNKKYGYQKFKFSKGDKVYLFTDGYIDQFGGERNKKFTSGRFREFIQNNYNSTFDEQKKNFENNFHTWKGKNKQLDDVLVIGLEL